MAANQAEAKNRRIPLALPLEGKAGISEDAGRIESCPADVQASCAIHRLPTTNPPSSEARLPESVIRHVVPRLSDFHPADDDAVGQVVRSQQANTDLLCD